MTERQIMVGIFMTLVIVLILAAVIVGSFV